MAANVPEKRKAHGDGALHRNERVVHVALGPGEGGVLLDLDTGQYYGLNSTGLLVWELIDGDRTLDEVVCALADRVEDKPPTFGGEVDALVASLRQRHLLAE